MDMASKKNKKQLETLDLEQLAHVSGGIAPAVPPTTAAATATPAAGAAPGAAAVPGSPAAPLDPTATDFANLQSDYKEWQSDMKASKAEMRQEKDLFKKMLKGT
jgi:lactobin A/cerein 7B family class IIb bacteriocin